MMKIAVDPVSIIACNIFCRRSCPGAPKRARALAANDFLLYVSIGGAVGGCIAKFYRCSFSGCNDSYIVIIYICFHYLSRGQRNI